MKKTSKIFIGMQTLFLTLALALPAQAAINIGGPQLSGSVVTIKSYSQTPIYYPSTPNSAGTVSVPVSTNPTPTTDPSTSPSNTQTPSTAPASSKVVTVGTSNKSGSVVSLKNIINSTTTQPSTSPSTPTTPAPAPTSPTPAPTPSTSPSPTTPAIPLIKALSAEEQQMVDMINQERVKAGVQPLQVELRLASVARAKAEDMKVNNYFDHTSPTYGSPWAMMTQVGLTYRWAGENLGYNKSVTAAMSMFMQSEGHRKNILDPKFTHIGVGIAYGGAKGTIYVQEFIQQ